MDSIRDTDFAKIFHRVTEYIDVAGCETPEDIEYRMADAIKYMRKVGEKAKKDSTKRKWFGRIKLLGILGTHGVPSKSVELRGKPRVGFAFRTIEYAEAHPRSKIALTLRHGKAKSKKIMTERLQKRLRALARK